MKDVVSVIFESKSTNMLCSRSHHTHVLLKYSKSGNVHTSILGCVSFALLIQRVVATDWNYVLHPQQAAAVVKAKDLFFAAALAVETTFWSKQTDQRYLPAYGPKVALCR